MFQVNFVFSLLSPFVMVEQWRYPLLQPLMELVKVTQENSSNKTADILADDQLQPPLDMVNFTQEQQQSGWDGGGGLFIPLIVC